MTVTLRSLEGFDPTRPISVCPRCGSSCLRQRKTHTEGRFICVKCAWLGNVPATRLRKQRPEHKKETSLREEIKPRPTKKVKFQQKPVMDDLVKYADIISGLFSGLSIRDQFQKYKVFETTKSRLAESGRKNAVKNKIQRIYNAFSEYTGIPCEDPDFVKIRVTTEVMALLVAAIKEEENRIRSSPRQSITFSK